MRINIKADRLRGQLRQAQRRALDLRPAFELIGNDWLQSIRQNFEAEGRPRRWPPLNPAYRAVRPSGRILAITGRLRTSITKKVDRRGVEVGTGVRYGAIHQFGGRTPPRVIRPRRKKALFWPGARHPVKRVNHPGSTVPARPFLMIQDQDWITFSATLAEYVAAVMGDHGS